ncbi:MAG: hypothetical protein JNL36_00800 [Candidatus Kapabacteria bacterium]|nr:hypothetical protein [Candidatus Kapabacteria bacterium]
MINVLFCCIVLLVLSFQISVAQWTIIANLPSTEFSSLASKDSLFYAATLSNILYKSTNFGEDWEQIEIEGNNVVIEKIEIIDSIVFIGTKNTGIYESNNFGQTFTKTFQFTLPISDFVKRGNTIYAASLGNGVYVRGATSNEWSEFNSSLPLNVAGNVTNILSTKDYLFIASGGNGVFHQFSTIDNRWKPGYFYGNLAPGLQITDAINLSDTIFVVNGNRVIVSTNDGQSWQDDKLGTMNGVDRLIYQGNTDIYLVTSDLQQGTWIQKREKYSPIGSNWSSDDYYIPNFYCFDIIEYNNRIYLASENGVYYKSTTTTVSEKEENKPTLQIHYQPISNLLTVHSSQEIVSATLFNILGQIVHQEKSNSSVLQIHSQLQNGVYGISIELIDGKSLYQTLLVESM